MLAAASNEAEAGVAVSLPAAPGASWKRIVEPIQAFLDAVAQRLEQQVREFDPALTPYAEYALRGNGKHLRPALVALSARALGRISEVHITAAVIIEMVHLATLVHDDVMDEAQIRRGQPTLAANWGNEIAVLFGDCLFAQALKLAASFPTPEVCRAVAAATNTVCAGEILQTQHRRDFERSRREYFRVLEMKTAELFALSCDLAGFLNDAPPAHRAALRRFGLNFGVAYQIYDDCLDLFGSETAAGKSLGTDLAKGKLTLPVFLAWERATPQERAELETLVAHWRPEAMDRVSRLLARYETLGPALEVLGQYLERARQALGALPRTPGRTALEELTGFLARQTEALGVCV